MGFQCQSDIFYARPRIAHMSVIERHKNTEISTRDTWLKKYRRNLWCALFAFATHGHQRGKCNHVLDSESFEFSKIMHKLQALRFESILRV